MNRADWSAHNPRRYQAHPLYQEPDAPEYAIPAPEPESRRAMAGFLIGVLAVLFVLAYASLR